MTKILAVLFAASFGLVISQLERSGDTSALPTFGTDSVFSGADARYVVTNEAAGARCAVAADIDGDGDLDIVSVSSNDNTVAWYERLSDGSFGPKNMISRASNGARIVTTGDIDQDNKTDVIVASYYDHTVGWFRNLGGGSFSSMTVITRTAISAQGVSVADIDSDGDLDVLSASSGDNTIAWYENIGGGQFCEVKNVVDTNAQGIRTVIAVDLDEDGHLDLAAASKDDNTVAWYKNDGTNQFEKIVIDDKVKGAYSIFAEDIDQDGHMDLITAANMDGFLEYPDNGEGGKVSLYRNANNGQLGSFTKTAVTLGNSTGQNDFDWFVLSVWAGDLDMDGDVDIASASFGLLHQGGISWYENVDGQGTQWSRHQIYETPGVKTGHYVFGADMDNDGDNDLIAVTNGDNKVQILTASTRCDNSQASPIASCCTKEQYWNGLRCISCELGSFLDISSQTPSCKPCPSSCPRLGLSFLPSTCHSMKGCGDVDASFARCDCGEGKYLDDALATCSSCPEGHITRNDTVRTVADYVMIKKMFVDKTAYTVSDLSWSGFNESRCHIPTCNPGYYFSMGTKACAVCVQGTYSAGGSITECSACPAGFHCALGTAIPQSCQPGFYSLEGAQECSACVPGRYAGQPGSSLCSDCPMGEYNNETAKKACDFCPLGTYMDHEGASVCVSCSEALPRSTTQMMRATNVSACVCEADTWRGEFDDRCTECPRGVDCSGADSDRAVLPGFYAMDEDFSKPFQGVWKCLVPEMCPGGPAESCANGRENLACATCPIGMYGAPGEDCQPCQGDKKVIVWCLWVAAIIGCITAYYCMNSPLTAKATTLLTTSCAFGVTITTIQSLGIFSLLNLPWPGKFLQVIKVMSIFLMDFEMLALECAYDTPAATPRYSTSVMFFFIMELIIASLFVCSRLLPAKWRWEGGKTLNVMGQFLQVGFTSMVCTALIPTMCYSHPNAEKSLLKFPHVVCGTSEHNVMMTIGLPLLLLTAGFYAACIFSAVVAPRMAKDGCAPFMQSVRFLLFRFRPDVWWWGLVLMMRAMLMSLAPVIATDDPRVQMVFMGLIIATFLALQVYFWPWKVPLLNLLDAVISVAFLIIIAIVSTFINTGSPESLTPQSEAVFTGVMLVLVGLLYASCAALVIMAFTAIWLKGPMGSPTDSFNLRRAPNLELLSVLFHQTTQKVSTMPLESTEKVLSSLPIYDLNLMERVITLIEQAGALPGQGRISWSLRSDSIRSNRASRMGESDATERKVSCAGSDVVALTSTTTDESMNAKVMTATTTDESIGAHEDLGEEEMTTQVKASICMKSVASSCDRI